MAVRLTPASSDRKVPPRWSSRPDDLVPARHWILPAVASSERYDRQALRDDALEPMAHAISTLSPPATPVAHIADMLPAPFAAMLEPRLAFGHWQWTQIAALSNRSRRKKTRSPTDLGQRSLQGREVGTRRLSSTTSPSIRQSGKSAAPRDRENRSVQSSALRVFSVALPPHTSAA